MSPVPPFLPPSSQPPHLLPSGHHHKLLQVWLSRGHIRSLSKFQSFAGLTPVLDAIHLPPSTFTGGVHVPQFLLFMALSCPLFKNTLHPNDWLMARRDSIHRPALLLQDGINSVGFMLQRPLWDQTWVCLPLRPQPSLAFLPYPVLLPWLHCSWECSLNKLHAPKSLA